MSEPKNPSSGPASDPAGSARAPARRPARRPWRLVALAVGLFGVALAITIGSGLAAPAEPLDRIVDWTIPEVGVDEDLVAPPPVGSELVVLQHGLVRSPTSLRPLERALRRHGYDVLNSGYPSLTTRIEEQAERLAHAIREHLAERRAEGLGEPSRIAFVGHSMGGLVIRAYLQRDDAVEADACVFCGTPQRGAHMAIERAQEFVPRLFFSRGGAPEQLLPSDPIHQHLGRVPARAIGTICGGRGDGEGFQARLPGDDDRMVGLEEAQLPEQTDTIQLFTMHNWLAISPPAVHQILHFLRTDRFDRLAARRW
jgi:triacylglycerol lipase